MSIIYLGQEERENVKEFQAARRAWASALWTKVTSTTGMEKRKDICNMMRLEGKLGRTMQHHLGKNYDLVFIPRTRWGY